MSDPLMKPEDFAAGFAQAVSGKTRAKPPVVRDILTLTPTPVSDQPEKKLPREREMYYGNQTRWVSAYAARSTRHVIFDFTISTCSVEIGKSKCYLTREEITFLCDNWWRDCHIGGDFDFNKKLGWWHRDASMVIRVYEFDDYGTRDNEVALNRKRTLDLLHKLRSAIHDMKLLGEARDKELSAMIPPDAA